jgi:hypothetical protein
MIFFLIFGTLCFFSSWQDSQLTAGPHAVPVRRFCAEYPNDKKSANLAQPLPPLQSTYYSQLLSSGLTANLQHLPAAAASQSETGRRRPTDQSEGSNRVGVQSQAGGGVGDARVADELMINEYGPCDSFDFRHNLRN